MSAAWEKALAGSNSGALLCETNGLLYESSLAAPLGTWHHAGGSVAGSIASPRFDYYCSLFFGFSWVGVAAHGLGPSQALGWKGGGN